MGRKMRVPLLNLSRSEIEVRALVKRQRVLDFLSTGEVFTSARIVTALVSTSLRTAQRLCTSMVRDGFLSAEKIDVLGIQIFGITSHGIALSNIDNPGPHFESGRVGPLFINHHLDCQVARLQAQAVGWGDWTPDRKLAGRGLKKVPDAIATAPGGVRVAVEIERTIKTPKRYAEIIHAHLLQVKASYYSCIIYISPRGEKDAIRRALRRVETVRVNGEAVRLTDAHFSRFLFVDLHDFPTALKLNTTSPRAAAEAHP